MSATIDPKVMSVARAVAREAMRNGALAIAITGSHARGDATEHSDIDIMVVGQGPDYELHRSSGHLVSVEWRSAAAHRAALRDPAAVGTAVPGWREAVLLRDPDGVGARLQRLAIRFRWEAIAPACDEWVAGELAGLAEEIHKLVGAMKPLRPHVAAVQRSLFALRMARIIAVHLRLLYGTENVLWDRVDEAMGSRWRRAQARAFGEAGESLAISCRAGLELYAIAAGAVCDVLDRRQKSVVTHACAIAGHNVTDRRRYPRLDVSKRRVS